MEYFLGTLLDGGLWLFDKSCGISYCHLSLDGIRMSMDWKNGMEDNDFHLGGHYLLHLASLRVLFGDTLSSRNLGVLNGGFLNGNVL